MINHFWALCLGFFLDMILGDPHWLWHPVRGIGGLIDILEKTLRARLPKTEQGELNGGRILVVLVLLIPAALTFALIYICSKINPSLGYIVEALVCYQLLAAKSLRDESMKVYIALAQGDLPAAKKAVSMIVGRDTDSLDEEGVAKAAIETVAENFADGVLAPMLFILIGGAPLGMLYKAANTMDSMIGYKNDKYMFFGRCAAQLDDVLNFIPARLGGFIMCMSAPLAGLDSGSAFRVFVRDRHCHKSPNSAHTEAAAAGALHVQLAGDSYYFGKLVQKMTIGNNDKPVEPRDIVRVNRLMYASSVVSILLAAVIIFAVSRWFI